MSASGARGNCNCPYVALARRAPSCSSIERRSSFGPVLNERRERPNELEKVVLVAARSFHPQGSLAELHFDLDG
jgi:hypothetical protein